MDAARPEAEAIAVKGDRILAVGTDREIAAHRGRGTRLVDLAGRLAIPGFIEGHGHYMSLGRAKQRLELQHARNWEEILAAVKAAAAEAAPGTWITGRGWHQEKWDRKPQGLVEGVPTHESLDAVSPNHPVLLTHASGHAAIANRLALEAAGIRGGTQDPPGGEIVKDARGEPTGYLKENAQRAVGAALAAWEAARPAEEREAETIRQVELAGREAQSKGVTSFQDAGSTFATVDLFRRLAAEGRLPVRLYVMVREAPDSLRANLARYRTIGAGGNFLTVRAIKMAADGALGSRGAWLLRPYEDLPSSSGLATTSVEEMTRSARIAIENDFQVNVHAIGDRANRETLDLYERVMTSHPGKHDLRWRIEHAQHLDPADIPRFSQLGVIASMQGIHCTSDGPWVPQRIGEQRARTGAYMWRSLMEAGALVSNGTDVPVEDIDPIANFHASVTRRMADGSAFYPDQRMTREEALRSCTWNAAFAAFEEDLKGSLSTGKLADITVLSKDIMKIPEDQIPTAKVAYTILGGKIVYDARNRGNRWRGRE
jgi:predicted amidohydrolase YtcJ